MLYLVHAPIPETGRFYAQENAIVLRAGMARDLERRVLWHELVHADRRDEAGHNDPGVERSVEAEALRRAMPMVSLRWALGQELERNMVAAMLDLPEDWIQQRLDQLHDRERRELRLLQDGLWSQQSA